MIAAIYARRQLTSIGVALLVLALLAPPARAEERPAETRIDFFDTRSNRTGVRHHR